MTAIDHLIRLLSQVPGFGPRSSRRAVLHLIKRRQSLMQQLMVALANVADTVLVCNICGNLDTLKPCSICADDKRDVTIICVVEDIADLWALERTKSFKGRYHVLGGRLSALEGVGPEDLNIPGLVRRVAAGIIQEVILATNLTVDGQTTAHYIADRLGDNDVKVTRLAHGVPVGGELDYLDDGTLEAALNARRNLG